MVRIAFIGLGAMGLPMARRIAAVDGVELATFDLRADRLDAMKGISRTAASIADAVRGADAVFTVLPADEHVVAVAEEVAAAAAGNRWLVDFSTIGPETIERVARRLKPLGTETVSVCLTRSTAAAQAGDLGLFVGGCAEVPTPLRPAFDAVASDVFMVGGLGSAKAFKIINNTVVAVLDILLCETIVLGGLASLSAEEVTTALSGPESDSWALRNHIIKYVLPDDLGPGRFSTRYMAKDVSLCLDFARAHGAPAFFGGLASAYYRGAAAHGFGEDYHMKVIRWLEAGAAVPRPVAVGRAEVLSTLVSGVASVEALVSYETLTLARLAGFTDSDAVDHLESGSAGNAGFRWWRLAPDERGPGPTIGELVEGIERVIELANRLDVPAMIFELARHRALGLAPHRRLDAALWEQR